MRTVPERRSSRTTEGPAMGDPSLTNSPDTEKLKVVPKVRVDPKESLFADKGFRSFVVLCALAIMAVVWVVPFLQTPQSLLSPGYVSLWGLFIKHLGQGRR